MGFFVFYYCLVDDKSGFGYTTYGGWTFGEFIDFRFVFGVLNIRSDFMNTCVRDWYEIGTRLGRDWYEIGTRLIRDWYEIGMRLQQDGKKKGIN